MFYTLAVLKYVSISAYYLEEIMNRDLTKGPVIKSMLLFAIPMILGDLLQ